MIQQTDAESALRSDWKGIFDYNLYGDPSLSLLGRDPGLKSDVVFLLDGSGSMVSPEPGKWQAAVDASVLFKDLMEALRHPTFTDRYRSVVFRWLWPGETDATTTVPGGSGMQAITVPLNNSTFNPTYTPEPAHCTPIGEGLLLAKDQFEYGTEDSLYTDKMIILLSDGKQNRGRDPLDVITSTDWPGAVKVFSVGLGEDDIEPETIDRISSMTYGDFRISPSPREIEGFFCEILCNTSWKLQNIPVNGTTAVVDGSKVAFIVIWDDPAVPVTFTITPPGGGGAITPTSNPYSASGVTVNHHPAGAGENHAFYVINGIPESMYGDWQFTSLSATDVLLKVVQDPAVIAEFSFDKIEQFTGEPLILTARITEHGKPLTGLTDVKARLVRSPALAVGTLLSENSPDTGYPATPQRGADITPYRHYLKGVMKAAGITSLSKTDPLSVILHDDGLAGDLRANDGIYTGAFNGASKEGSYSFKFDARGSSSAGYKFQRGEELSTYVNFKAQPDKTEIVAIAEKLESDSNRLITTVRVIPKDSFGAYLGPFKADLIGLELKHGTVSGAPVDNMDGSYTFTVYRPVDSKLQVTAVIGDVIVADRQEIEPPEEPDPGDGDQDADDEQFSGSLHAGLTLPVGDAGDFYDSGFSAGVDLEYQITPELSLVGILGYKWFQGGSSLIDDTYWFSGNLNLKASTDFDPLRLFVKGGPGFYVPESGSTRPGFNIGGGVDYDIDANLTAEFGLDYHYIDLEDGDFTFFDFQLGILFRF